MKENPFGSYDHKLLEEKYVLALKNPDFAYVVSKVDLPDEELMKHTSKIEASALELKNCKNCPGIDHCKNKVSGLVYYPSVENGRVRFNYIACKYKRAVLEDEAKSCNYYEMPLTLKSAKMKEIFTDDANRLPAVKWLKTFYDTYEDNRNQKGLYLHGSFGSGKTYLVCAMLNELAKKGVDITVVYYPELLRSLKESFDKEDFGSRMSRLKRTSILMLDDIGAESVTPWARDEILGTILQYRMDAMLPTFFTSNLTINELEEHLSNTKNSVDKVKARRIIERVRQLTTDLCLISQNRRN